MTVKQLEAKLKKFPTNLDVFVLVEGDSTEREISDVIVGELDGFEDDGDNVPDDGVFILT